MSAFYMFRYSAHPHPGRTIVPDHHIEDERQTSFGRFAVRSADTDTGASGGFRQVHRQPEQLVDAEITAPLPEGLADQIDR